MPTVDFHMHVTTAREYAGWFMEWLRPALGREPRAYLERTLKDPGAFVAYLDQEGIDYAVCLAETNPLITGISPNHRVARFCAADPRLIPMANINPYVTADPVSEFRQCVEAGHQGFKFYPVYQHFYPDDPRLYPIYGLLQDHSLPAMFHTGSSTFPGARLKYGDPTYLDDVAVSFPELTIILSHAGRGFWYDRAFFLARLHPNVHLG